MHQKVAMMDGEELAQASSPAGRGREIGTQASGLQHSTLMIRTISLLLNHKSTSKNKNKNCSKTRIVICSVGEEKLFPLSF